MKVGKVVFRKMNSVRNFVVMVFMGDFFLREWSVFGFRI